MRWEKIGSILTNEEKEEEAGGGFASDEQRRAFFGLKRADKEASAKKAKGKKMQTTKKVEFVMGMKYHMPLGFQKKGTHSAEFISKDNRWHARVGNFGTMIVTDRKTDKKHVVKGKMPEVEKFVNEVINDEE